jgi:hypothetical protein
LAVWKESPVCRLNGAAGSQQRAAQARTSAPGPLQPKAAGAPNDISKEVYLMATRPCYEVGQDGLTVCIQQIRPTIFQLTLGALELASLISAARWVAEGAAAGPGSPGSPGSNHELTPHSVAQLRRVLARYDEQWRRI